MTLNDTSPDLGRKIDRRLTRSGWVYMLALVVVLFMVIYAFTQLFQVPLKQRNAEIEELNQRVEQLESRLDEVISSKVQSASDSAQ